MAKKKKSNMREKVRNKADKNKSGGGLYQLPEGTEQFKPKKQKYELDFLPYEVTVDNHPEVEKGDLWWERTVYVHFNVGPEGKARICPKTIGKACPVCEERKELMNSGDEDSEKLAQDLKPKMRVLYNVIDLNDSDKGVQFFEISYYNFGSVLDEEIREGDEELADFPELEGGKTVKVRFSETSFKGGNPYVYASRIDFDDRDDYDEEILNDTIDLDNCFTVPSYDELSKELHGVGGKSNDDEDEDEEEEESPAPRKSKMKGKKKKSDDESDEEEEKPKKSGRGKKKKKNECPHGHEFGVDCDSKDECEDCEEEIYEKCLEKYEELEEED